ncbi:hypothetical protein FisN_16Lh156 [Fistulifera solaris]|uniref:Uncharacterized protein n=1 Tax=Fistulifera solaris TaxID=1519565 RepID=A0A1Z5KK61_FISSO|nr:hypothetical protein FisN_16Lh156 [Fistulifera solaris]|eukprot:GAX26318.1 hypothetical protein FisN_16Lh156 [Fistulifera solaris]
MPHVELPQAEFKVVLLGDTNTGKTSLVLRFVEGSYRELGSQATIGAHFLTKRITVQQHIPCKLLLWDTAGQQQFSKLAKTYYQQAAAAILTYDVSQPQSLHRLRLWLDEVQQNTQGQRMVIAIAACKSDLDLSLHAPGLKEEAEKLAQTVDAIHIVTSARTNEGVQELFQNIAENVWKWHQETCASGGLPIPVHEGGGPMMMTRKKHARSTSPPSRNVSPVRSASPPLLKHKSPSPKLNYKDFQCNTADEGGDDVRLNSQQFEKKSHENMMCTGALFTCTDDPRQGCVIN